MAFPRRITPCTLLLSLGGIGFLPLMPATFASAASIPLFLGLRALLPTDTLLRGIILIILFTVLYVAAVSCIRRSVSETDFDQLFIVIDEFLGMFVSLLPIFFTTTLLGPRLLIAFIGFRFFDILKPMGITTIDRQNSPHAVLLDDLLAGFYVLIIHGVLLFI